MSRSDNGDDVLWKEIAKEVYKDADRLFKMIGEAYAVLSEPTKVLICILTMFVLYAVYVSLQGSFRQQCMNYMGDFRFEP